MAHMVLSDWLKKLDLFGDNLGRVPFDLSDTLEHLKHLLPNQGPIKDFIHHNPLHGFQSLEFHDGLELAASLFGSKKYLGMTVYEEKFKSGLIKDSDIESALKHLFASPEKAKLVQEKMLNFSGSSESRAAHVSKWGIRQHWFHEHNLDLASFVSPVLFRLLSSYLDQGVSFWPIPARKDSLWESLKELNHESLIPVLPFGSNTCNTIFQHSAEGALGKNLERLVGDEAFFVRYLLETILVYPGWAGMVCALETNPSSLRKPSSISLLDFLALSLTLEVLVLEQQLGSQFKTPHVFGLLQRQNENFLKSSNEISQAWHEAFEWSLYDQIFRSVYHHASSSQPQVPKPWAQAIFCIDERECSLRRYLEILDPGVTTFGTAGFFGVDFWFLPYGELYPMQQSPVTITPKHLVRSNPKDQTPKQSFKNQIFETAFGGLFKDVFLVPFLSVSALTQLVRGIFFNKSSSATSSSLNQFERPVTLEFLNQESHSPDSKYKQGFTVDEMVERVNRTLRTIGLTEHFAESIYVVAHGASSSNNPHYAAYDCGACSGKSGAPNARAFAWMANFPPVREKLKTLGINIPDSTVFYSVLHDTTQDRCLFFEEDLKDKVLPSNHSRFRNLFRKALDCNAKERSRRLELIPSTVSIPKAAELMANRAHSIFEPRPELNHATNASAIVGRRELTRGLFLDRRSFLQSYDPFSDPSGDILAGILGAVIPVCGGINLEYFFSRMDNEIYGAGTKLSHNVVGLMGVSNGVNNDLIPGLPLQMIEAHDPVRLLILIDQEPEIIEAVLKRNPSLYEWVNHHWVRMAALSPSKKKISIWGKECWVSVPLENSKRPDTVSTAPMDLAKTRTNLTLGFIDPNQQIEVNL